MEEVPDEQYEESEKAPEEPVEPVEPEPVEPVEPVKVCKPVKKDLKEKIQCACGRWMSQHTYKYQHKCKAQTVDEASKPPAPPEAPADAPAVREPKGSPPLAKPPKLKRQEKPPPAEKPIKQKSVIKKQARLEQHPLDCLLYTSDAADE